MTAVMAYTYNKRIETREEFKNKPQTKLPNTIYGKTREKMGCRRNADGEWPGRYGETAKVRDGWRCYLNMAKRRNENVKRTCKMPIYNRKN